MAKNSNSNKPSLQESVDSNQEHIMGLGLFKVKPKQIIIIAAIVAIACQFLIAWQVLVQINGFLNAWSYILLAISLVISSSVMIAMMLAFLHYSTIREKIPQLAKLKSLDASLADLKEEFIRWREKIEAEKQQFDNIERGKLNAEMEWKRILKEKEIAELWLKENEQKVSKIDYWRRLIDEYEGEAEDCERNLLKKKDEISEVERFIAGLNKDRGDVEAELDDLRDRKIIVNQKIDKLVEQKENLNEELPGLRSERSSLVKELNSSRLSLEAIQTDISEYQNQIQLKRDEQDNLQAQVVEITAKLRNLEKERDATETSVETFKEMLNKISTRVDTFQKSITPPSPEERMQDFERPILIASSVGDEGVSDEKEKLETLQSHLSNQGLIFDPRTIFAFHTSLKVSESSPLVVLAGISGTGKSLLPRVYSEIMGIHFLNMAVQPRWDSPQDMFGFYNYMEHRYKATDLARALRQMDQHNYPAKTEDQKKIQSGMLMVLLDEMNLARVEYYFSDLLSKLEIRKKTDISNPYKRNLASIDIELGSIEKGDESQVRPLFVGYNVMFVGTMNEDETTQSLSDKVLDRSNVLRFGKPDFKKEHRVQGEKQNISVQDFLSSEQWENWQNSSLSSSDQEKFLPVMNDINSSLNLVGRAFGRRMFDSIGDYIANYPNWISTRFNDALADQMEQRILPRLRGISEDTDEGAEEALDKIGEIINDTGDQQLADAYSISRESPVFHFQGVQRN